MRVLNSEYNVSVSRSIIEIFPLWLTFHCSLNFVFLASECQGSGKWLPWSKSVCWQLSVCPDHALYLCLFLCFCDDWRSCCTCCFSSRLWYISSGPSPGSTPPAGSSGSWCSGGAPSYGELCNISSSQSPDCRLRPTHCILSLATAGLSSQAQVQTPP